MCPINKIIRTDIYKHCKYLNIQIPKIRIKSPFLNTVCLSRFWLAELVLSSYEYIQYNIQGRKLILIKNAEVNSTETETAK